MTKEDVFQSPFMRQVYHLLCTLAQKEIRLSASRNLPVLMVEELYELGSHDMPRRYINMFLETKVPDVHFLHLVMENTELITKNKGKMFLSDKGKTLLYNHNALVRTIVTYLFRDFDTSSFDGCEEAQYGNTCRLYSLWLLHHFGQDWQYL